MNTDTQTDEIETALEACDAVEHVRRNDEYGPDGGNWQYELTFTYGTETTEPVEELLAEYDLRIWSANFSTDTVILAPRDGFSYGNECEHATRVVGIEDRFELIPEVRRVETLLHASAPRLRIRVEMEYAEKTIAPLSGVLSEHGLGVYAIDFRHGAATLVPVGQLTYGGDAE